MGFWIFMLIMDLLLPFTFVVTFGIFQNRFELKVVFHFFPLGNASAFS